MLKLVMNFCLNKCLKTFIYFCLLFTLLGCSPYERTLRIGAAPWPSFEFAFLANELNYLDKNEYSLFELTSSTSVIQAFQSDRLDVAFLSLDEVLTLVALGVDLKIISVIDNSYGGDALLVKPEIKTLNDLKYRSIGYENRASGALLLNEIFSLTELNNSSVQLQEVKQNEAKSVYLKDDIDALIVREPVKQELLALGARELISSKKLSFPSTNVMIARTKIAKEKELEIAYFLKQFYRSNKFYNENPSKSLSLISERLQLYPHFIEQAFTNTQFIPSKQALMRLSGSPSNIELQMNQLNSLMSEKNMFNPIKIDLSSLISTQILELAIYE